MNALPYPEIALGATALLGAGAVAVLLLRGPHEQRRAGELTVWALCAWLLLALVPLPRVLVEPPALATRPMGVSARMGFGDSARRPGHPPRSRYHSAVDREQRPSVPLPELPRLAGQRGPGLRDARSSERAELEGRRAAPRVRGDRSREAAGNRYDLEQPSDDRVLKPGPGRGDPAAAGRAASFVPERDLGPAVSGVTGRARSRALRKRPQRGGAK